MLDGFYSEFDEFTFHYELIITIYLSSRQKIKTYLHFTMN